MSEQRLTYALDNGDSIFVDCTAYGVPGYHWCRFSGVAPGSASVYPIKFEVPDKGIGQCKPEEVMGVRTSEGVAEARAMVLESVGKPLDAVREGARRAGVRLLP
jgi:hypothetical protein